MSAVRWLPARSLALVALAATSGDRVLAQCGTWADGLAANGVHGAVEVLHVHDDGGGPALYVGGSFTVAGDVVANRVARWDGTGWEALGAGVDGVTVVRALASFDDGGGPALYVAGNFASVGGGVPAERVARWSGGAWSAVGAGLAGTVNALAVFDDGSGPALYAGGSFQLPNGVRGIARWDGAQWGEVGGGIEGYALALAVHDDGQGPALFVGGSLWGAGGVPAGAIARWDGAQWSDVGGGVQGFVASLAAYDDGAGAKLWVGGNFIAAGGQPAASLASWDGSAWGGSAGGTNGTVWTLAAHDDGGGAKLWAAGYFTLAGGLPFDGLARFDGSAWSAAGGGSSPAPLRALRPFDDGGGARLHAGGFFSSIGGAQAVGLARWDGSAWSELASAGAAGPAARARALAVHDDGAGQSLFVGGEFSSAGGVALAHVGRFDGEAWHALGAGLDGPVRDLAAYDAGAGAELYAAGAFALAGGAPAANVARWDGAAWHALGAGLDGPAHALLVHDAGDGPKLYVGGAFTTAGGVASGGIARWDGAQWSDVALGVQGGAARVDELAACDLGQGARLFAAGSFTHAGGVAAANIASFDGAAWSPLGPWVFLGEVRTMLAVGHPGSQVLFVGGDLGSFDQFPLREVAMWDGTIWNDLGSGMNAPVDALALFDDGSGTAPWALGTFTIASGAPAERIARWSGAAWLAAGSSGASGPVDDAVAWDGAGDGADLYVAGAFALAGGVASGNLAALRGCAVVAVESCAGDGSLAPCPCGNSGAPGRGCENSAGTGGARLAAHGTIVPDTLVLSTDGELDHATTVFLQGSAAIPPAPFGDGLRCAGGQLHALYVRSAVAGAAYAPGPGAPSVSARARALGDALPPGSTRWYQAYYRDPVLAFCGTSGSSWNATNAVAVAW